MVIWDIHCIWDFGFLIEKTQQVSFGIVPKGIRIMFLFSFSFLEERVRIKFGNDIGSNNPPKY